MLYPFKLGCWGPARRGVWLCAWLKALRCRRCSVNTDGGDPENSLHPPSTASPASHPPSPQFSGPSSAQSPASRPRSVPAPRWSDSAAAAAATATATAAAAVSPAQSPADFPFWRVRWRGKRARRPLLTASALHAPTTREAWVPSGTAAVPCSKLGHQQTSRSLGSSGEPRTCQRPELSRDNRPGPRHPPRHR